MLPTDRSVNYPYGLSDWPNGYLSNEEWVPPSRLFVVVSREASPRRAYLAYPVTSSTRYRLSEHPTVHRTFQYHASANASDPETHGCCSRSKYLAKLCVRLKLSRNLVMASARTAEVTNLEIRPLDPIEDLMLSGCVTELIHPIRHVVQGRHDAKKMPPTLCLAPTREQLRY